MLHNPSKTNNWLFISVLYEITIARWQLWIAKEDFLNYQIHVQW